MAGAGGSQKSLATKKSFIRRFTRAFLLGISLLLTLAYLLAVLGSFISPEKWWVLGPLSLVFPWLALALVFSFFFWLAAKPRFVWLPLATLLVGYLPLSRTVTFKSTQQTDSSAASPGQLRIATWNIQSFNGMSKNRSLKKLARTDIARQLSGQQAQVLCLQEFNTSEGAGSTNNLALFEKEYPYHFFSREFRRNGNKYASGCIIFSKYPIRKSGRIDFPTQDAESLIYADVEISDGRLMRIFTTHLQSFRFSERDHLNINELKGEQELRQSLLRKMKTAYVRRAGQAQILRKAMDEAPHAAVLCGDFNDVPSSYAYHTIRGHWQDAFLARSWGIGRTYLDLSPTLRIDYILASPQLKLNAFTEIDEGLSDHVMLQATVQLP